jgi:zinc transporter ZupT
MLRVFLFALGTALATGLGALPFARRGYGRGARKSLGVENSIAAGLMGAASGGLVYEGLVLSAQRVALGFVLGLLFIALTQVVIERRQTTRIARLQGKTAQRALMLIGIMTLHSAAEGIGLGVSFGGGETLGLFITAAIAVHNIPEGLAISLVLIPHGVSVTRAAGWSIFSSLPQPLLAVPAFLFVTVFTPLLPLGLGFAAGAMFWMVFADLLPEALQEAPRSVVAITVILSGAVMTALQLLIKA